MSSIGRVVRSIAIAAAALTCAPAAFAQETGGVTVRGFVSQGYLHSSANRLLGADTDQGTFAFSEAAVNVSAQPLPKLRVAAQLFARDLGAQGNHRLTLDWAVGEYRAWDQMGFRFGRIKFPVGLYNTFADADVARPEILQPSGIYPPDRRDLTNAIDGGGVFGTFSLGRAGHVEYEAMYGTLDLDESYTLSRAIDNAAVGFLPALAALRLTNTGYVVSERTGRADSAWGGYVEWAPPVPGLRLRTGFQGADVTFGGLTTYSGFAGPAPVSLPVRSVLDIAVPYQVIFSAEYARGGLRLSAEHARLKVENTTTFTGMPFPIPPSTRVTHPQATYGQVAYRFNPHLQASSYYSVSYADGKDKEGRAVSRGEAAHTAWTKDLAFTLRVDVNAHWLVKAEVHRLDGSSILSPGENPGGREGDWTLFAVKTTLHF
jgi:hypothetical protein